MSLNIKTCRDGIQFPVIIQSRSSKNKICELQGESLKIRLTSPPVDGAANKMCIKFLASQLGIASSQISIVRGQTGRNKLLCIKGMGPSEFLKKIPNSKGVDP